VAFHVISREYQISSPGPFGAGKIGPGFSFFSLLSVTLGRVKRAMSMTQGKGEGSSLSIEEMCKNEQSAVTQKEIRDLCLGGGKE
jgi:hypothetical protein